MKNFIIAIIFLAIVTMAVIFNSLYANNLYKELYTSFSLYPDIAKDAPSNETMAKTDALLNNSKMYLYLTVPQGLVNEFFCDYHEMLGYYHTGETPSYIACLEKVKLRLQFLKKTEALPFSKILF